MVKKVMFKEIFLAYKKWVISNPNVVTDVETMATWSSYFVAGKINDSAIISELVYTLSKLLTLYHDRLLKEKYGDEVQLYGLQNQIKLMLTVVHYCEVFVELVAREKWGARGKWTVATLIQMFKCSSALILLFRYKEVPLSHPPIAALQRKKITLNKEIQPDNSFFTLQRSGRTIRRVEGAPPPALRDWQPVKAKEESISHDTEIKNMVFAELLHVLRPILHLGAMRMFGTKAWKQWAIALGIDFASIRIFNKCMNTLTYAQRLEINRRKFNLILYLLRTPLYNGYSKNVIESVLNTTKEKIPITRFIARPIMLYLNHWQDIYFYMWSS